MPRFPFGIPNSWFFMLYSDDLAVGAVERLHYLGRELVAFRGEDGQARILDAYCAHLGAHLAVGGQVVGNTIRCPFHAWRYDGDGACVDVPYASKIPPKARVHAWPVREVNGMIFVWHHAEGKPPSYEIPELPEWANDDWTRSYEKYAWTVKTHPQEIMENAVDWHHFQTVHGMDVPGETSQKFEGPMFHWNITTSKTVSTMDVRDDFSIHAQNWGLGFSLVRYDGMFSTLVVTGLTPVDGETTHFRTGIIGRNDGRSEDETRQMLKAYMDDQCLAIEQDFAVWENKRFQIRPTLCEAEGALGDYRRWVRQFYSHPWWETAAAR